LTQFLEQADSSSLLPTSMTNCVRATEDNTPGGRDAAGFSQGGKPMSEQMIVLIVELAIGILRLIEAAYN